MPDSTNKEKASKVYCEKCNSVFDSQKKYDEHYSKHSSGVSCESCPLDMAVEKILNLFKRRK